MKRRGMILPTLFVLMLLGVIVLQAGWSTSQPAPRSKDSRQTDRDDPLTTEAIQRWRSGQPQHWRHCLLQQ
jgi:hypothetical protein